jgi:hypothetical protein
LIFGVRMPMTQRTTRTGSIFGALACFLFAGAVLVASFEELSRYGRNGIYLFRDLGAVIGEWPVRIVFALLFVAAGMGVLRATVGRPPQ